MENGMNELLQKWIIKAENDMKTAEMTLNAAEIITDTLCFHCQQAVEKYLKMFIVSRGIMPEKTHKIELLLDACMKIDTLFETLKEAVALTEYAVELRYPDDFSLPSLEEAKTAYEIALKVKAFVLARIR